MVSTPDLELSLDLFMMIEDGNGTVHNFFIHHSHKFMREPKSISNRFTYCTYLFILESTLYHTAMNDFCLDSNISYMDLNLFISFNDVTKKKLKNINFFTFTSYFFASREFNPSENNGYCTFTYYTSFTIQSFVMHCS